MKKGLAIFLLLPYFLGISQRGFFVENKGQHPENVLFSAKLNYGEFFIEKDGSFKIKVLSPNQVDNILGHKHEKEANHHRNHHHVQRHFDSNRINSHTFKVKFINADFSKNIDSKSAGTFHINLFQGKSPDKWVSNLNPYSEITLKEIYPKIDLKVYFKKNSIKYDFILHPSANPEKIKIQYLGLEEVNFAPKKLILRTSVGNITDENPTSYFLSHPSKNIITNFKQLNSNTFTLKTGIQTITKSLVIDPQLNFSSFTGATLDNWGYTATYDESGYAYAGGIAFGGGYPTKLGSFQSAYGGGQIDMTISKFSPDGRSLIYSTYIGGSGLEAPHSMVVNSNNELVIYGITSSTNYPISSNAFDKTFNGGTGVFASNILEFVSGTDIVITKLNVNGDAILGSTYYGGSGNDALNDPYDFSGLSHNYADDYRGEVTTDNANNIFISSVTSSNDLPTPNGFQTTYGGGSQDGCVAKFNPDLSAIIWGSYFGGSRDDACYASKQNSRGETYITGGSNSSNWTLNGRSNNNNGGIDGFIARISADGSSIINGTFVGTSSYDQSYFVEVDFEDKVYCFGQSMGSMPTTAGVYKNTNSKQFLQKYSEDLSTLEAATVIGSGNGRINIVPGAFMVSNCKEVYLSGWGGSVNSDIIGTQNMPITSDAHQSNTDGSDFYFMLLGPDFASFKYGSYFGGITLSEHVDGGTSRFDRSGTIYQAVCAGCGASSAFPVTPTAYSTTNNSNNCNLAIIKMDISKLTANIKFTKDSAHCKNDPVFFDNESTGGNEYKWIYPDGSISESFDGEFFFSDTGEYVISLIAIDSNQCPYSDTANVKVEVVQIPDINIDIDTFICADNSLTIHSIGGPSDDNYTWWSENSTYLEQGSSITVQPDSTTEYFVEYTNDCGADTTKVQIPVFYPPKSSSIGDTACEEESPSYFFYSDSDYVISELNKKTFELKNDSIYFPQNKQDTYYIITESSCGSSIDTFNITINTIDKTSTPDTLVCAGSRINLFLNGGDEYLWTSPELEDNPNDSSIIIYPQESQLYTSIIYKGNCFAYDTVKIDVIPSPPQNIEDEYIIQFGKGFSAELNANYQYSWTPNDFLNCNNCNSVNGSPDKDITYYFTYNDNESCQFTDSIVVKVIFPIFIPNTFTPNGDGKNEVFKAHSEILQEYQLLIYDRWGNLAFKTTDLTSGWDGTINGNPQPQDVYVYKLRYMLKHTRKWKEKVGIVSLIR